MNSVLITIKTDPDTNAQLKDFASELGVSTTAFINMVMKQVLRDRHVVSGTTTLQPTYYLEQIMRKVDADIKANKNISKAYDNVNDFFSDLDKTA